MLKPRITETLTKTPGFHTDDICFLTAVRPGPPSRTLTSVTKLTLEATDLRQRTRVWSTSINHLITLRTYMC